MTKKQLADEVEPLLRRFFASDEYDVRHGFIANREEECKWGALWFIEWLRFDKEIGPKMSGRREEEGNDNKSMGTPS